MQISLRPPELIANAAIRLPRWCADLYKLVRVRLHVKSIIAEVHRDDPMRVKFSSREFYDGRHVSELRRGDAP
jgi:hypothetical protein